MQPLTEFLTSGSTLYSLPSRAGAEGTDFEIELEFTPGSAIQLCDLSPVPLPLWASEFSSAKGSSSTSLETNSDDDLGSVCNRLSMGCGPEWVLGHFISKCILGTYPSPWGYGSGQNRGKKNKTLLLENLHVGKFHVLWKKKKKI